MLLQTQGLITETDEGPGYDAFNSDYWRLTQLDDAWNLMQVSDIKWEDPVVAIIDYGFSTTNSETVADFSWGFLDVENDDGNPWHGTNVSSTVASPFNNGTGAAGTCFLSKGSVVEERLDEGEIALFWLVPGSHARSTVIPGS